MTAVPTPPRLLLLLAGVRYLGGGTAPWGAAALAPPVRRAAPTTIVAATGGGPGGRERPDADAGAAPRRAAPATDGNAAAAWAAAAAVGATLSLGPLPALADDAAASSMSFWDIRNPTLLRPSLVMMGGTLALWGGFLEMTPDPQKGGILYQSVRKFVFSRREEAEEAEEAWTPPLNVPYGLAADRMGLSQAGGAAPPPPPPPPTDTPYGLAAGRNRNTPPEMMPPTAASADLPYGLSAGRKAPEGAAATTTAPASPPTDGVKNPFIRDVEEYCVAGAVSDACTGAIQRYLVSLSDTGEAATAEDAATIAAYLDSMGRKVEGGPQAFAGYLDSLSSGATPPPSAAGVESYVALDRRLAGVEERVTTLEGRVDALPDEVFRKVEALQRGRREHLSEDVKRIAEALANA